MTNGKSPGSDGHTVDFNKFVWEDIGPLLYRSLYLAYESGSFTDFQYQGVITCIPKEGKDRRFIGNWRPISLLNTDLKIASAVIANRIKPLLPFIISDTQKGFIKGRFIGENTRLLYDLMHFLEQHNKTGLLLLVDFEKAFDSVEWKFLKKALSSFNFGPSVCKWFELFYSKAKSCVINNGHMSNCFSLERGCRQGDPLSPYLFIIGVELLSLKLKANQDIHGIIINEVESLISLYADDTFLILDGSENSLREALECFESFYKVSGLKMNSSKTKAVWVGNKKYSDQIICPNMKLNWSHENFKVLGIDFSLDLNCITDIHFTKKIKEVKAILKSWQHRKLTLLGKITVIKSLALPKLITVKAKSCTTKANNIPARTSPGLTRSSFATTRNRVANDICVPRNILRDTPDLSYVQPEGNYYFKTSDSYQILKSCSINISDCLKSPGTCDSSPCITTCKIKTDKNNTCKNMRHANNFS